MDYLTLNNRKKDGDEIYHRRAFYIFLLALIYFLFCLWMEARRERDAFSEITGETLPAELRENALRS